MPRPENPIQLAVIGAAHGTRGEVRVKTFTGDPLAIADYGLLYDEQGKSYEVLEARPAKTVVVVRFKGINDRNAAEALNGTELFIDRSQLPDDELDEEEFYQTMLIPFTEAAVPEIDFDKGILLVEPHAAGLIAEDEDERPQGEKKKPKK